MHACTCTAYMYCEHEFWIIFALHSSHLCALTTNRANPRHVQSSLSLYSFRSNFRSNNNATKNHFGLGRANCGLCVAKTAPCFLWILIYRIRVRSPLAFHGIGIVCLCWRKGLVETCTNTVMLDQLHTGEHTRSIHVHMKPYFTLFSLGKIIKYEKDISGHYFKITLAPTDELGKDRLALYWRESKN